MQAGSARQLIEEGAAKIQEESVNMNVAAKDKKLRLEDVPLWKRKEADQKR